MNQPQVYIYPLPFELPSHLPPHPTLLSWYRAPVWVSWAIQQIPVGYQVYIINVCFHVALSIHHTLSWRADLEMETLQVPGLLSRASQLTTWFGGGLQTVKNPLAMQETWVQSLGWEDSPGAGNGYSLQCSCLGNPMDRGDWRATVHGVTKSWTRLSNWHFFFSSTWKMFKPLRRRLGHDLDLWGEAQPHGYSDTLPLCGFSTRLTIIKTPALKRHVEFTKRLCIYWLCSSSQPPSEVSDVTNPL